MSSSAHSPSWVINETVPANSDGATLTKSLPSSWFRNEAIFQLERRAIFSKVWLLACHESRMPNVGDYLALEIGSFSYFLIRDEIGNLRGFHNTCRQTSGTTAQSIRCAYHNWTYKLDGQLRHAPKFDSVPEFDMSQNGLFPIHVHCVKGFVFVNFSAEEPISFSDHFGSLPNEWEHFMPDEYEFAYSWSVSGEFNWKTLINGFQECYHCAVVHPTSYAHSLNLDEYKVHLGTNYSRHEVPSNDQNSPMFTYIFPTNGVTVTENMFYILRVCPVSPTTTRLEYDVFKRKSLSVDVLRLAMQIFEQVEQEDYDLCQQIQKNLNTGIYGQGVLHPAKENGVIYFQGRVLDFCQRHIDKEKERGREVFPASPLSQMEDCAATRICEELREGGRLSW